MEHSLILGDIHSPYVTFTPLMWHSLPLWNIHSPYGTFTPLMWCVIQKPKQQSILQYERTPMPRTRAMARRATRGRVAVSVGTRGGGSPKRAATGVTRFRRPARGQPFNRTVDRRPRRLKLSGLDEADRQLISGQVHVPVKFALLLKDFFSWKNFRKKNVHISSSKSFTWYLIIFLNCFFHGIDFLFSIFAFFLSWYFSQAHEANVENTTEPDATSTIITFATRYDAESVHRNYSTLFYINLKFEMKFEMKFFRSKNWKKNFF